MLLTIDKVLQLLAEGKSVEKIAELAACGSEDVIGIIERARELLAKYERPAAKKKLIVKKKSGNERQENLSILSGADFSAIPMNSRLIIFTAGDSVPQTKSAGIGLIITDEAGSRLGKVAMKIGRADKNSAICVGIKRALDIAAYFSTEKLSIRISSETLRKFLYDEIALEGERLNAQKSEIMALLKQFPQWRIDSISDSQNDRALFLARKSCGLK